MADELTPQQQRFVAEYLIDLNATQAAIRAGYSRRTAAEQASRLLRNVKVQTAVAEGKQRINTRLDLSADRVKLELARIAYSDIRNLYDAAGNLKPIHDLDDDTAAALSGIEVDVEAAKDGSNVVTSTYKVRRFDKNAALTTLARWHGKLSDRMEHTGKDGAPLNDPMDLVEAARRLAFIITQGAAENEKKGA